MPSTGTFEVKMAGLAEGAAPSITEAGPPDRMMPRGSNFSILAWSTDWKGWISQYTPASRTRRAINWVTWEPKSTISKRSAMGGYKRTGGGLQCGLHPHVDAPPPTLSPRMRSTAARRPCGDMRYPAGGSNVAGPPPSTPPLLASPSTLILLSPARGRGGERGKRKLVQPPLLASPPSGGEEYETLFFLRRQ